MRARAVRALERALAGMLRRLQEGPRPGRPPGPPERPTGLAWPPGHFYSPIPDLREVERARARIFGAEAFDLPGIDLDEEGQLALFDELRAHYDPSLFPESRSAGRRYWFNNDNFRHGEALVLTTMIRHLGPRRVVEVGCGYSSAVLLDTRDDLGGAGAFRCTFIEPHPDLLLSLLRPGDRAAIEIVDKPVQEVGLDLFRDLEAGDVLVIDSTHVLKTGSDVNWHLFRVLPSLRPGVHVHVHDVHYPFEYPPEWVLGGRAWNEAYALRAFLQYNGAFRITFFNSWFGQAHRDRLAAGMPLAIEGPGSSLWLRRL